MKRLKKKPQLTYGIHSDYFEDNIILKDQASDYEIIDGYYMKTIAANDLALRFDDDECKQTFGDDFFY